MADQTIALLPHDLATGARDIVDAAGKLFSLVRAVPSATTFKTQAPEPAGALLRYYREAQRRFHVSWQVLAAVNYIESKFGRVKSASYAGAQGPMQFIPSTWQAYGLGGDIHDPHDAILGAANYLHASGAPGNDRSALYHYNRSWEYVDAVLLYAKRMTEDSRAFYDLYNWQVFVVTKAGDVRLTGPGL
jgi:Transglycosylase SLT domain